MTDTELLSKIGKNNPIGKESVHIWLVNIDEEEENLEFLSDILLQDELDRAEKFVFKKDKKRYLITHAILRLILSRYIQLDPKSIRFSTEKRGKPILNHPEYDHIKFNLSHSGKYIIYAISNREVGIDIECITDMPDSDQIVNRFFSKKEIEEYFNLPLQIRKKAFYTCWTRKEAFVKAIGDGLYMPLDKFSVSPDPNNKSDTIIHNNDSLTCNWLLEDIDVHDSNYVSAIAVEGCNFEINFWNWKGIDKKEQLMASKLPNGSCIF